MTSQALVPVYREDVPVMTVEETLAYLGYENQNGVWVHVDANGTALIGVDIEEGFIGGNLATAQGNEVVEPTNELAALQYLWDVKALTRDYHPKFHCSFSTAYRAYVNNTTPHFMTIAEFKAMGNTDNDVLTPEAIAQGLNIKDILEALEHPDSNGGLMVWVGDHCAQGTPDSEFAADLITSYWDFVQTKGWKFPNWEEYGVFFAVLGYLLANNGFHENLQHFVTSRRRMLKGTKTLIQAVKRAVFTGLVSEYCVITSANQAQELGYDVAIAIDAVRPFDRDGEAAAFARQLASKQKFVSNATLVAVNEILAKQFAGTI